MGNILNEKIKEFWGGFVVGGFAGVNFLFTGFNNWGDIVLAYTLKFFASIIFALVSGICTVAAVDFYKHKIKHKLFGHDKEKDKSDGQDQEAA